MAERALRGSRLGAVSYENDDAELAERQVARYGCPNGHHFSVPFSVEAEVPEILGMPVLRFGRRSATTGRHLSPVTRQDPAAPTGTCCSSGVASRSWRRSSRSVSPSCG